MKHIKPLEPAQVFGRWVVVKDDAIDPKVLCQCECGTVRLVTRSALRFGSSTGCGCSKRGKHHQSHEATYKVWCAMKARCSNKEHPSYERYGGRGIRVCDRWIASYEAFISDMGPRPDGATLDRENNDKGYEKGNCNWVTHKKNCGNTSRSKRWTIGGREYESLQAAALEFGVAQATIIGWCEGYTRKGKLYAPRVGCSSRKLYP